MAWKVDSATFHSNGVRQTLHASPTDRSLRSDAPVDGATSAPTDGPPENPHVRREPLLSRIRMLFAAALTTRCRQLSPRPQPTPASAGRWSRAINYVRSWSHRHRLHFSRAPVARRGAWARHLMRRDVLAHSRARCAATRARSSSGTPARRARRQRTSCIEWLDSPPHRQRDARGDYRLAGAGRRSAISAAAGATIWVVRFAR